MEHIQKLIVDIDMPNYISIPMVQYDTARILEVSIINKASVVDLTDHMISVGGTKPDGYGVLVDAKVYDAKKGIIRIDITDQMLSAYGDVKCELKIIKDTKVLTTKHFVISVSQSVINSEYIVSSNEFQTILEALAKAEEYNQELLEATEGLEFKYTETFDIINARIDTHKHDSDYASLDEFNAIKEQISQNKPIIINDDVPIGSIIYRHKDAPLLNGWLVCEGQELVIAEYPELFAILGYTHGGQGTTFKLPKLIYGDSLIIMGRELSTSDIIMNDIKNQQGIIKVKKLNDDMLSIAQQVEVVKGSYDSLNESLQNSYAPLNEFNSILPNIQEWIQFKGNGGSVGGDLVITDNGTGNLKSLILERVASDGNKYKTLLRTGRDGVGVLTLQNHLGTVLSELLMTKSSIAVDKDFLPTNNHTQILGGEWSYWKDGFFDNVHIGTSSANINGYTKIGNGLLMQWGYRSIEAPVSNAYHNITFAIAFPSACLTSVPTFSAQDSNGNPMALEIRYHNYNVNGMEVRLRFSGTVSSIRCHYWAIGY